MNIENIPDEVLYVQLCAAHNILIGFSLWEKTITKYPEYFPVETKRRNLWESIPQNVKDKYNKAIDKMYKEVYGRAKHDLNLSKGILHRINNPEEYIEYDKEQDRLRSIYNIKEAKLHKKYFGKYGYKKQ